MVRLSRNTTQVRAVLIVQYIKRNGPTNQKTLARVLDIPKTSLNRIVSELKRLEVLECSTYRYELVLLMPEWNGEGFSTKRRY